MSARDAQFVSDFESGRLTPEQFDHAAHIDAAFLLLRQTDFLDAANRYGRAVRQIAERAGQPGKFNVTITLAFLALIAERLGDHTDARSFREANPELANPGALSEWYPDPAEFAEGRLRLRLPRAPQ